MIFMVEFMKKILIAVLIGLSFSSHAEKLVRPPDSITGIGNAPCADFVSTYEAKQRIDNGTEKDPGVIAGTLWAYGDFMGTFGGFFARSMMENGDKKLPFSSKEHSMSLVYETCKENPDVRYIDIVYVMSETAFGRKVNW